MKKLMFSISISVAMLSGGDSCLADDGIVRPTASTVALIGATVIDGTGRAAKHDQVILISNGYIVSIGDAHDVSLPPTATRLDLQGRTVLPGLVGMHDHLFYELAPSSGTVSVPAQTTFARLYLAAGVTTIRTTGTVDFDGDKR